MTEPKKTDVQVSKLTFGDKPMPLLQFVAICRLTVDKMRISSFCRLRRCARKQTCVGRLMRRRIPEVSGGGDDLTVWLPLCIAGADDVWLEGFIAYWHVCRDEHLNRPIHPPEAVPNIPPLDEEWPHADVCSPETLPSFLFPNG